MSGIAGIINLNNSQVDKQKVNALKDNLAYRAQD